MKYVKFFIFLSILTFTVSCGQQKRYIQYKVKQGETISKIAQKLDMKTTDLLRLNPDVTNEPAVNSFLVVPERKLNGFKNKLKENGIDTDSISNNSLIRDKEKLLEELKEKYVIYEVKKGDTFYNLNKTFAVTKEQLLVLNPELKEGLKVGQLIKLKEISHRIIEDEVFYDDYIQPNTALKVALLLPFRAAKYNIDTLKIKDIFTKNATLVNIATDFYMGAEIAVDSLRKIGLAVELSVFDTGNRNGGSIRSLISKNKLSNKDVVIGPFYSNEVELVANNVTVPVVFPVYSSKQSNFYASNIITTAPEKSVFREELQRYFKENFDEGNIIIVSSNKSVDMQSSRSLKSSLEFETSVNSISILTPRNGYIAKERFLKVLKPNTKNWVVIVTDNNIIVGDAINSLISLPEETTARVFTFNKGKVYNGIDNRKLAKVGFTYVSDEFVDEKSLNTRVFNRKYKRKNKALPSFYATKGFDITYDILVRLASGNSLNSTFDQGVTSRVETKFDYINNNSKNKGLFIVQYNKDLSLTKLK